ncbi:MAG TPA: hypothetical protein VGP56_08875, partial [Gaiellaceae bacterium]|nr:hypothetical protein [Gaiellaceae bacterium]
WTDTPSLRWLCYLARRLEGLPLQVTVAMRPPEQGRDPELLTELLTDPVATQIRPEPLRIDSITALVRRRYPDEEPEVAFCEAVEAATRGNPLFVIALVDIVVREGIQPHADQAHLLLDLGPQAVRRAVSLRLARLPDEARALIEAACILGDGTELRHVAALAGLDAADAARAARELVRSDLLTGRSRSNSSTPSCARRSVKRSTPSPGAMRTAAPRRSCSRPARLPSRLRPTSC